MFNNYSLNLPLNATSFGNVSMCILREFYDRGLEPSLFPIAQPDISGQNLTDERFGHWINGCIQKANGSFKRKDPALSLWHLQGSQARISEKNVLFSFYECDSPTTQELNIVKNQDKVLFACDYNTNIFKDCGATNVYTVPLCFDKWNFKKKIKQYRDDGRIVVNIFSKFENRKAHDKIIKLIAKKWGNDARFMFQFAIFNPFFNAEQNKGLIAQALEGRQYWNMQFLGWIPTNEGFNDYLNSADIFIGASQGESWGLPEFHSLALGKWGVVHNATGYKEFANSSNASLFPSCGKVPSADNVFFISGAQFNQGNFFCWDSDDFIKAFDLAVDKFKQNPVNMAGLILQDEFSSAKMVNKIIDHLDN